jgi:hypothetical protein
MTLILDIDIKSRRLTHSSMPLSGRGQQSLSPAFAIIDMCHDCDHDLGERVFRRTQQLTLEWDCHGHGDGHGHGHGHGHREFL